MGQFISNLNNQSTVYCLIHNDAKIKVALSLRGNLSGQKSVTILKIIIYLIFL